MKEKFLKLENISVVLPGTKTKLFSNFSLELLDQNITGLIGSNGCGKTILAKTLSGLIKVKSGKIFLFGKDVTKLKTTERLDKISLSFQMVNMSFLRQTISDEINYTQKLIDKRTNKKVKSNDEEILRNQFLFKGKENQHPLTLSGGEKRKLSFHLLKLNNPDFYILDEPTVGLDYFEIQELKKEIQLLKKQNKKVLLITHNLQFLLALTDEIVVLEKDQVKQQTFLKYQGSLEHYLMNQTEEARSFLTFPIEFEIFMQKIMSKELEQDLKYETFLEMNSR